MNNEELKKPEFQERLRACKSAKEVVELARDQGIELTDEQLEQIAGGSFWGDEITGYEITCGYCGGTFDSNLPNPRYCQCCGIEMSW